MIGKSISRARLLGAAFAVFSAQWIVAQDVPGRTASDLRQENPAAAERASSRQVGGSSSTVAQTISMDVLNDSQKLGFGDRVSFRIVEERTQPIPLFVTDSGEMEVPLIGRVKAAGKSCKELAFEIKPMLEKDYFRKATVIIGLDLISTRSRGKIYITGQVRAQGVMELLPDETDFTVSRAILRAGGLADFADKRKVKLVRKKEGGARSQRVSQTGKGDSAPWWMPWVKNKGNVKDASTETIYVDLVEILEKGHLERDPVLKAGDLIVVPARLFNF
ncbi:MAG: polysaccharide biosynthesis/export family protein [Chthoniobacteraceae bacterium]